MFRPAVTLLMVMLAWPAGAEIYKWKDAQGKVHYGDQPPSNTTPGQFTPRKAKEAEQQGEMARRKAADLVIRQRMEQAKAQEEEQRQLAEREAAARVAENCQRVRNNLEMLQRPNMRLTVLDARGQEQLMDESLRRAETERALRDLAEHCSTP